MPTSDCLSLNEASSYTSSMPNDLRAPTPCELELLRWMLEHGRPEARAFLPQLEGILVSADCECGCPSLKLSIPTEQSPVVFAERILVQAASEMQNSCIGLILWAESGKLADFEVWEAGIDERPYDLPALDTLRITG
jgi:hypothetical protein